MTLQYDSNLGNAEVFTCIRYPTFVESSSAADTNASASASTSAAARNDAEKCHSRVTHSRLSRSLWDDQITYPPIVRMNPHIQREWSQRCSNVKPYITTIYDASNYGMEAVIVTCYVFVAVLLWVAGSYVWKRNRRMKETEMLWRLEEEDDELFSRDVD